MLHAGRLPDTFKLDVTLHRFTHDGNQRMIEISGEGSACLGQQNYRIEAEWIFHQNGGQRLRAGAGEAIGHNLLLTQVFAVLNLL